MACMIGANAQENVYAAHTYRQSYKQGTFSGHQKFRKHPISIYTKNPYYFQDEKGRPLVLVGDYTWDIFTDTSYDYVRLFDTLKARKINFVRLWLWKLYEWHSGDRAPNIYPNLRTGPGLANDGKPKYDLAQFNPAFFDRLKKVCQAASERGIYLQLMLMDAWMLKHDYLWRLSACNRNNNINHVDGDPQHTGKGTDGKHGFCSMGNPLLYKYQKAYIRKVVETVNSFNNIFYEIANENYYNEEWELSLCDFIKKIESDMPKQHMTIRRDFPSHHYVVQSWDPEKVHKVMIEKRNLKVPLLFDTDWITAKEADKVRKAAWTAIATGGHFDFMDGYLTYLKDSAVEDPIPKLHRQIGYLAQFVQQITPWKMEPDDAFVKEGKAFAMAGKKVLFAYLPLGGKVQLHWTGLKNKIKGQWYDPLSGRFSKPFSLAPGKSTRFQAPGQKDWVLLLRSK